ncbi:cellulose binding domain-containing protein [Streptomyces sp. NPDC001292]|uniref:cellulose binding domain-containing protein n=1 Tax=Streptomyces sp. NPDC001292 TaxID=3364558 RepID=UPI00368FD0BA
MSASESGAQPLSSGYSEQPWLGDAFGSCTGNPNSLPVATHEILGTVARRGLFVMENPYVDWLAARSGSVAAGPAGPCLTDGGGGNGGDQGGGTGGDPGGGGANGTCTAAYRNVNSWPGGFQGEVPVRNNGTSTLNGWTVGMTLASGQSISSLWDRVNTGTSGSVTVRNSRTTAPSWPTAPPPSASPPRATPPPHPETSPARVPDPSAHPESTHSESTHTTGSAGTWTAPADPIQIPLRGCPSWQAGTHAPPPKRSRTRSDCHVPRRGWAAHRLDIHIQAAGAAHRQGVSECVTPTGERDGFTPSRRTAYWDSLGRAP